MLKHRVDDYRVFILKMSLLGKIVLFSSVSAVRRKLHYLMITGASDLKVPLNNTSPKLKNKQYFMQTET